MVAKFFLEEETKFRGMNWELCKTFWGMVNSRISFEMMQHMSATNLYVQSYMIRIVQELLAELISVRV